MKGDLSFFYEKFMLLKEIQSTANGKNCFEKLVEYFKVCQDIREREMQVLDIEDYVIKDMMLDYLVTLPFCLFNLVPNLYLDPAERDSNEKFLGCESKDQPYERYFECKYKDSEVGFILTFNDYPSMDTIAIFYEGIYRTLHYINDFEKDEDIVELMVFFIYCYFQDQITQLEQLFFGCKCYIAEIFFNAKEDYLLS
jgi:hypothetical protein